MSRPELGQVLLTIARTAIARELGQTAPDGAWHAELAEPGATFVTLKRAGQLRGCIGSLRPLRPLGEDVRANAVAAAFRDPRFPPLAATEFPRVSIEVSLLTADEPVAARDEAHLRAQLRPGQDGVVIQYGLHRATFLPQVWESFPDARDFLAALKRKAGLPDDFWSAQMNVSRYGVTKWQEAQQDASELQR